MPIINDDVQSFDSKTLYEKAFYDPIPNHYNWNHLVAFLEMPLDTLKLDKSFVDKVGGESDKEQDIAVVRHIVSLAKELKFICLAEGAEKKTQVDKLRELGCDVIQGYYFSKPIPISEYETCYL